MPHKGLQSAPPWASLLANIAYYGGESLPTTSPKLPPKKNPTGRHGPSIRQPHYNPPVLSSTQFPQLGRTTNNRHPTLSYPIHNPPIPHGAMIQRQSSTKNLRGASRKPNARSRVRAEFNQLYSSKVPAISAVGWSSPRATPPRKPFDLY